MTTQTAVFSGLPSGLTLTKKVFTLADPDTEVAGITGAVTERTNALGQYVVEITKSAVLSGDHTIILFVGSTPIATGKRTFAGTDGETATETPEVAELNTDTRVKLAANQPDYVPATASALSDLQTDVDANTGYLTSLSSALSSLAGKFAGITLFGDWLRRAFRKDIGTAGMIAAQAEINTGGTSTFTGVTHSLEAIANTAASNGVTLTLGATVPLTVGQVTGLTEDLVVGDSYTEEVGRRIPVTLTDKDGNPVSTVFGSRSLADTDCTIMCVLHPENSRNTDNVTAAAQGECEFVEETVDDPAALWLSLPNTQTSRLSPGVYLVQFRATWDDGEAVTLAWKGSCKFVRRIKAKP